LTRKIETGTTEAHLGVSNMTQRPNAELWTRSGDALALYLKSSELTLRQLGEDLNVSHETVRKWTRGAPIGARHLWTVARIADFDLELRRELVAHLLDLELEDLRELVGLESK
jgi:transcriptional regulator with XRE-family HTH domain